MDVVVHGGAGAAPDAPTERLDQLREAARRASRAADPAAAVVAAIAPLEASPRFNAGIGSAVQADGTIRTDAGLMTDDGSVGAACSMPGVVHAIRVADAVRTETPHVLVSGEHACRLARHVGVSTDEDLWSYRSRDRWAAEGTDDPSIEGQLAHVAERYDSAGSDTVGAVATDGDAVAAATSTGGRWHALAGRVGDVPQVGCGFFAAGAGGASATGVGEDIARTTLAREVVRALEAGRRTQAAVDDALAEFDARVAGTAGLIALSPDGRAGIGYTTDAMQTAVATDGQVRDDRAAD